MKHLKSVSQVGDTELIVREVAGELLKEEKIILRRAELWEIEKVEERIKILSLRF
jgi:hypothetical protein